MTTTESTTIEPTGAKTTPAAGAEAGAVEELGELLMVDPRSLIVGVNVRTAVDLGQGFVADVAARGVREPITVRRDAQGRYVVRKGQRRTMAAVQAGLAAVRVFVDPGTDPGEDDTAGRIARTVDQLAENDHRDALDDKDRVRAHQELLDLGLSAGQIARKTHTSTKKVRAVHAVAASELARAVLDKYDLTLDQAAIVAELDDGTPAGAEAAKLLTVTARTEPEQFAHVAQRIRDARAGAEQVGARVAELAAEGITVLADDEVTAAMSLSTLRPSVEDAQGTELTVLAHAGCPGHAAHVRMQQHWKEGPQLRVDYYCIDATTYGHVPRWDVTNPGSREKGPMTDAEKAERRLVISRNREWDSATTVRRQFLTAFLARKTAPKDAAGFIAHALAGGSHDVRKAMESGHRTACALLGLPEPAGYYSATPNPLVAAVDAAAGPRLTQLSLAVLLGGFEESTSRDTWRRPTAANRGYFETLASWGYTLSAVESLVIAGDEEPGSDTTADTDQQDDAHEGA